MRVLPGVLAAALLTGCTTVGVHDHAALDRTAFGPPVSLAVCAYLDEGIPERAAEALLAEAWGAEGARYGVGLRLVRSVRWPRPAFGADGIMAALRREPFPPDCDRVVAFVGRHAGDVLWGLLLPQALGAVDAETRTRAFVVARPASLDQLVQGPAAVLRHELYHMLGCDHEATLAVCYERIATLKRAYRAGRPPAWDPALGWVPVPATGVATSAPTSRLD